MFYGLDGNNPFFNQACPAISGEYFIIVPKKNPRTCGLQKGFCPKDMEAYEDLKEWGNFGGGNSQSEKTTNNHELHFNRRNIASLPDRADIEPDDRGQIPIFGKRLFG